ncbi:MAG: histidinol-phosphate transaminase [Sinobacteraceae bacterium]|nr:histidinol-phosphate transaminase [Nevskiaceae bacterium]
MNTVTVDDAVVLALARPDIVALAPYEHALYAPTLERLHANELPWPPLSEDSGSALHRYPEPQPAALVAALAAQYGVSTEQLLIGRGSDEGIDLLTRAFCRAGVDAVITCPPTFGMYAVAARIQGAEVISVPLVERYALDDAGVIAALSRSVKLVWLCSPNNPTGNSLDAAAVRRVLEAARGRALVVIDEAYIEFSKCSSWIKSLPEYPHLVILRTLSKAQGLAGARIGTVIASPTVIRLLRKIIPPYAIARPTSFAAEQALQEHHRAIANERIERICAERERLRNALIRSPWVKRVYPSDANFLLLSTTNARRVLERLQAVSLLARDFSGKPGLDEAVRLTVGTPEQNNRVIEALECSP